MDISGYAHHFVTGSFKSSPLAIPDSYACTGNVGIQVPVGSGLIANDFDDNVAGLMVTAITNAATTMGGQITIATDGSFTYIPPAGFTGADRYTYTLIDGNPVGGPIPMTDDGVVTFTMNNLIWFVDNSSIVTTSDGRRNSPFKTLADFNSGSAVAGDVIYLEHTGTNYTGGIVLANNERLFGKGHTGGMNLADVLPFTLALNSLSLPAINDSRPVIVNASGDGVTLASGNTLRGFDLGNCSAFGIDDNGAVGSLSISEVNITNGTGGGFRANNGGTLAVTIGGLSSTGGPNRVHLNNCTGSFQVTGSTSVLNSTGTGINIAGNSATVTFGALNINNSTSNQTGLFATGGTINTSSGAISSGSGMAVDIDNASLGITLTSVSSNGGSTVGIDLNSTTGSSSVTGTATTDGSGGTIQNKTGNGAVFIGASNISLKNLNLLNCASTDGPGPCGNTVTGNSGCNAAIYLSSSTNFNFAVRQVPEISMNMVPPGFQAMCNLYCGE